MLRASLLCVLVVAALASTEVGVTQSEVDRLYWNRIFQSASMYQTHWESEISIIDRVSPVGLQQMVTTLHEEGRSPLAFKLQRAMAGSGAAFVHHSEHHNDNVTASVILLYEEDEHLARKVVFGNFDHVTSFSTPTLLVSSGASFAACSMLAGPAAGVGCALAKVAMDLYIKVEDASRVFAVMELQKANLLQERDGRIFMLGTS